MYSAAILLPCHLVMVIALTLCMERWQFHNLVLMRQLLFEHLNRPANAQQCLLEIDLLYVKIEEEQEMFLHFQMKNVSLNFQLKNQKEVDLS